MPDKDLIKINGESTREHEKQDYLAPSMREVNEWMSNWNHWFDNVFNNFFSRPFDVPTPGSLLQAPITGRWSGTFMPAINMSESDNEFLVTAELPGITEKDIDLAVSNNNLLIKGEKKQEAEDSGTGWHRVERSYGKFQRSIPLPQEVDAENIEADFKNGVLSIHLPKLPEQKSGMKKIPIKIVTNN